FWLPSLAMSQTPELKPKYDAPSQQGVSKTAKRQEAEELRRLRAKRDALTQQILQLEKSTGNRQQIVISVQMCELSLNQARSQAILKGQGGFRSLLSERLNRSQTADRLIDAKETQHTQISQESGGPLVIKDDKPLKQVMAQLVEKGALKILATPTLTTISDREVSLHSGGEVPIPVVQKDGEPAVELRPVGTQLSVHPVTVGQGRIRLELRSQISEIDRSLRALVKGSTVPGFRVRRIGTNIEMNDGETAIWAGLVQQRRLREIEEKIDEPQEKLPQGAWPIDTQEQAGPTQGEFDEIEFIVIARVELVAAF
ncbi:MAG: hypothetical protein ACIALR_08620, partial [Blastopirellula sp. JB062]